MCNKKSKRYKSIITDIKKNKELIREKKINIKLVHLTTDIPESKLHLILAESISNIPKLKYMIRMNKKLFKCYQKLGMKDDQDNIKLVLLSLNRKLSYMRYIIAYCHHDSYKKSLELIKN